MSWSTSFEATSSEDIRAKADAFATETTKALDAILAARQQEQIGIAAAFAVDLASKMGGYPCFVQINGHAQAQAGPGDCIGVYVNRK
jgi:hypothetical protein